MTARTPLLVFSDLDGTLLDALTYSEQEAAQALAELRARGVPLILVSSKTRAEMESIRKRLHLTGPFVVENGGAVYVPDEAPGARPALRRDGYAVAEFGTPYPALRLALKEIAAAAGADLRGFGDLSVEEVAAETGLTLEEAARAKQREYDEPFRILQGSEDAVRAEAERRGLRCLGGGRFRHLLGRHDKGQACRYLIDWYRRVLGPDRPFVTVALGDAPNDVEMLALVDHPILVQQPGGIFVPLELPRLQRVEAIGPRGWNRAVLALLAG